jgi:hypothetical protein
MNSDRETVMAVYDEWEAVNAKVAALSLDALTHPELLELQHRREVVARGVPTADHQIINRLVAEADPKALGGTNLADVLSTKLCISNGEAKRRIKHAGLLGPRQALTGETLPPKLPNVAAAQARGQIGAEHVKIIESSSTICLALSTARPAIWRRPTWHGLRRGWGPRSSVRLPIGWRSCSTRTAICQTMPIARGADISRLKSSKPTA